MLKYFRLISTAGFLLLIFSGLIYIGVHAVSNREKGIGEAWSWSNLVDGKFTAALAESVDDILPKSKTLNGWLDGFLYWSLGDTGPQVRQGCAGWLFLTEELVEVTGGEENLQQHLLVAEKIAGELKKKGVDLLVVPVPDKASQVPAQLCGTGVSTQARLREAGWQEQSRAFNFDQIDLFKAWPAPGYWRTDTHWDQQGAQYAAGLIASAIAVKHDAGTQSIALETALEGRERIGDLTRLADLAETSAIFGPVPDTEYEVRLHITRTGGLLDDAPEPEIILAGSSYSLNSYFHEYLQTASSREIVQKSQAGGGFTGAIFDLLDNNPQLLERVKMVVWEWPMRTLTQPLTEREKKFLSDT